MSVPAPLPPRPLLALTGVVVAVHLVVLQQMPGVLEAGDAAPGRVKALTTRTLVPAAPPAVPAPAAAPVAVPRPSPAAAPPAPAAPRPAPAPDTPNTPFHASNQPLPSVDGSEVAINSVVSGTTTQAETPVVPLPTPPLAEAVVAVAEPGRTAPSAAAPLAGGVTLQATVPAPVHLYYDVTGQARSLPYSARGELLWRHDGQRYQTQMVVSAFLVGSRSQTSEGNITPQGLAPRRFGDKSRNEQAAHFHRDTQRISFSANTPEAILQPGAQDRLSVVLQLGALLAADPAQLAPGASLTLQVVGPRDAELWRFTAEGESVLNLPNGTLQALKFIRVPRREFDTRIELWLAPSLHYLPVRIRLTQANGDFVDQQLRASEPLGGLQ
jgi:hypothetical protein